MSWYLLSDINMQNLASTWVTVSFCDSNMKSETVTYAAHLYSYLVKFGVIKNSKSFPQKWIASYTDTNFGANTKHT